MVVAPANEGKLAPPERMRQMQSTEHERVTFGKSSIHGLGLMAKRPLAVRSPHLNLGVMPDRGFVRGNQIGHGVHGVLLLRIQDFPVIGN